MFRHKKFIQTENEPDHKVYERTLTGRMTKSRVKAILRWARKRRIRYWEYCGHDYDCCGCQCGQWASVVFPTHDKAVVTFSESFNY